MTEQATAQGFAEVLRAWPAARVRELILSCDRAAVLAALSREHPSLEDAAALLSPAALPYLETMARQAAALTRRRFGNVLQFYAPLYVSNYCVNACVYCGFNRRNSVPRRHLTVDEAVREAEFLAREGFRHLLLVSGEDEKHVPVSYLAELASRLRGSFASLNLEVYPLDTAGYRQLVAAGIDSLTLYQETYDPELYARCHPAGPKRDYLRRLGTMERAAAAGVTFLGIGCLLGLGEWRTEAFWLALHADWLQRNFWRQQVSVSFPRMRQAAGGNQAPAPVSDADLTQMLTAMRLFLPDAGMVLSTRESAPLRDALLPLGITRLSAGSRTAPGAYTSEDAAEKQFAVQDERPLAEVMEAVRRRGFDPICKDWDNAYHPAM